MGLVVDGGAVVTGDLSVDGDFVVGTASIAGSFVIDSSGTLTAGNIPWARLSGLPSSCPSGEYVSGIGGTLTCSAPAGTEGGGGVADNLGNHIATLDLNMSSKKITNLGTPCALTDAATKGYVDTKVSSGYTTGGSYGYCRSGIQQLADGTYCDQEISPGFCEGSPGAYFCRCLVGFTIRRTGFYDADPDDSRYQDYYTCIKDP